MAFDPDEWRARLEELRVPESMRRETPSSNLDPLTSEFLRPGERLRFQAWTYSPAGAPIVEPLGLFFFFLLWLIFLAIELEFLIECRLGGRKLWWRWSPDTRYFVTDARVIQIGGLRRLHVVRERRLEDIAELEYSAGFLGRRYGSVLVRDVRGKRWRLEAFHPAALREAIWQAALDRGPGPEDELEYAPFKKSRRSWILRPRERRADRRERATRTSREVEE